jgi:hypothetical protein
MNTTNVVNACPESKEAPSTLPPVFLNAYEVTNATQLAWPVNIYTVELRGEFQNNDTRGRLKNILWDLRKKYKNRCPGYGFVLDIGPRQVAVPQNWQLPNATTEEFTIKLEQSFVVRSNDHQHRSIWMGILREAVKARFKNHAADGLGPLWQDYNSFCQYPSDFGQEYLNCRRFGFGVKLLHDGRWIVRLNVGTITLDGRTFRNYYEQGKSLFSPRGSRPREATV